MQKPAMLICDICKKDTIPMNLDGEGFFVCSECGWKVKDIPLHMIREMVMRHILEIREEATENLKEMKKWKEAKTYE